MDLYLVVTTGYFVDYFLLRFDRGVVQVVTGGYFVDRYCLQFDREVVLVLLLVILSTIGS